MRKLLIYILLIFPLLATAENLSGNLNSYFSQMDLAENDTLIIKLNEKIKEEVLKFSQVDSNFLKKTIGCNRIGSVISDDNKLKIISWNYRLSDNTFSYEAVIIKNSGRKNPQVKTWTLTSKKAFKPTENEIYNSKNWYGALYYNIVSWRGKYILLGYSTYNNISKIKVIEILDFKNNQPILGEKVFKKENFITHRMVFEYSFMANMSLVYDSEREEFIFDHLSPEESSMKGLYQYYGPDFSIDILKEHRRMWILEEDVDIRNKY